MTKAKKQLFSPLLLFTVLATVLVSSVGVFAQGQTAKEMFNEGLNKEKEGDLEGAILAYKSAIKTDENYVDAYLNLGSAYFKNRNFNEALDAFKSATEKDSKNVDAFANLAKVQYVLKRYAEAENSFKTAIGINPTTELYEGLGKVYYKKKNYKEVIDALNKCHELGGGSDLTYYMLGKSHQKTDNTSAAITALNKSISMNSDNYNSYSTLGQIYLSQEKYSQAAGSFQNAMNANPKNYRAAYNFAVAKESASPESYSDNIKHWEAFIRVAKNNPKAKRDVEIAQKHVEELRDAAEQAGLQ